jgi:flagellar basal body-associated protein FliL
LHEPVKPIESEDDGNETRVFRLPEDSGFMPSQMPEVGETIETEPPETEQDEYDDFADEPDEYYEEETDDEPEEEPDMSKKNSRKKNAKKNKKQSKGKAVRNALLLVLAMAAVFAVTFAVFFHLLGGSFKSTEDEATESPNPTETIATETPSQESAIHVVEKKETEKPKKTEKPTQAPTDTPQPTSTPEPETELDNKSADDYKYDKEVIRGELSSLSREEIKIIYYEIYARHGYEFGEGEEDMKRYFSLKDWYEPVNPNMYDVYKSFNAVETQNIKIIEEYQREQGWRN